MYVKTKLNNFLNFMLRGTGIDVSEEWIGTMLLAGLPDKYEPRSSVLDAQTLNKESSNVYLLHFFLEVPINNIIVITT